MAAETVEVDGKHPAGFDLSKEQAHKLCSEYLAGRESIPAAKFGCYIFSGKDPGSNLGRFVEGRVFMDAFDNTPEIMRAEYDRYDDASTFFVIIDHEAKLPVGVMRVIENSEQGLKSFNDLEHSELQISTAKLFQELRINPDKCADIATLAVLSEYRGQEANYIPSLLLYRTLYITTLDNPRFDHAVTIIDRKAERNLQTLRLPFKPIDQRYFSYLDSPQSRALYAVNEEFYPTVEQSRKALLEKAATDESGMSFWLATALDGLANGTGLDEMLAFDKQTKI